ncbi:MAG: AMP-binding protein [Streptosporangiaceae bacterium]|jgi:acyl-CoA synthetase (AMP-forming)/AMP-acid ligase II
MGAARALHGPEFTGLVPALSPARKPAVVCSADLGSVAQPWEAFTVSDPTAPFIIGYTSGTTGFPKGAVYDGEGMYVQYLRWAVHFGLDADSTLLTAGPMFHNSYGGLSLLALARGAIGVRNVTPFLGYVNPASPLDTSADGRYLLSGDVGRFAPDGRLLLVDRKKDIIVTGGENVASGEVERVLAAYPQVLDVAVVGRADERWGEAVTAVVVFEPDGTAADADALRAYCRERLAPYKVPKRIEFTAALPRNSMGKVQKFLLRSSAGTS